MSRDDLLAIFPNLLNHPFEVTSEPNARYNCMAWVVGDDRYWWEPYGLIIPVAIPPMYWPNDDAEFSVANYGSVLAERGYEPCADGSLEEGIEKVVLYTKQGQVAHIARQVGAEKWTSKLGKAEDIEHTLEGLAGERYGEPTHFFKRQ